MLGYWASFARDGRPVATGEAAWGPYGTTRAYMRFADAPGMSAGPPNGFDLHEAVVRRRSIAGVAWHWNVGIIAPPLP